MKRRIYTRKSLTKSKRVIKELRNRVRDLTISRNYWRTQALNSKGSNPYKKVVRSHFLAKREG